jgi:uncharacterized protein (TIGR02391 family)
MAEILRLRTLFLKVRERIQPIADFYRSEIKKQYPSEKRLKEKLSKANNSTSTSNPNSDISSTAENQSFDNQQKNINASNNKIINLSIEALLHPLIHKQSYQFYLNKHYREAVLNSITAIFDLIRDRTGLDLDGSKLANKAFSVDNPLLVLSDTTTDSGRNDQVGFMQIFSGAYQGIRNPKAHSLAHDLDQTKAAQYLIFASLLARRVSEAKKVEMKDI